MTPHLRRERLADLSLDIGQCARDLCCNCLRALPVAAQVREPLINHGDHGKHASEQVLVAHSDRSDDQQTGEWLSSRAKTRNVSDNHVVMTTGYERRGIWTQRLRIGRATLAGVAVTQTPRAMATQLG